MTVLVAGASGATGRLLVSQLLERGLSVKIVVRDSQAVRGKFPVTDALSILQGSILDIADATLAEYVRGCDAVASCLGHNLTLKGIFGKPRFLVTDATKKVCAAIRASNPAGAVKFVLMNTTGNKNENLAERRTPAETCASFLIRNLVPPQKDNEEAAEFLRTIVGPNDSIIEWVAVRPDSLIDETHVSEYEICASPTRSPVFNSGKTSRINTAHFMAELIADNDTWKKWKGAMPVVYNRQSMRGA